MPLSAPTRSAAPSGTSPIASIAVLAVGIYLGVTFVKSEVAYWQRIHDMFLFREARMYLIIGTAIVVAMISMLIIKHFSLKSVEGEPIRYRPKPYHLGVVFGGVLFGAGWAITGACPGKGQACQPLSAADLRVDRPRTGTGESKTQDRAVCGRPHLGHQQGEAGRRRPLRR